MASQQASDYELLTEHLGYPPVVRTPSSHYCMVHCANKTPQTLLDDIINTVNVLADRALDSVEQVLLNMQPAKLGFRAPKKPTDDTPSTEDAARREIESGTHQLETLLTASIDRNFDKLELYAMQNILTVQPAALRPYVQLEHYRGLDFSGGGEDAPDVEGVTALRRRVQASQRLNLALQREKARNEALLGKLRDAMGVKGEGVKQEPLEEGEQPAQGSTFGFLNERSALSSIGSQTPITTTTEFTLSQLTALRSLSQSLRGLLPELQEATEGSSNKTWRSERAEYVEQSSRKYLENTGGLELGSQGEVRDGDYQGEGRNLRREEVEGLEKVVAILGEAGKEGEKGQKAGVQDEQAEGEGGEAMDES